MDNSKYNGNTTATTTMTMKSMKKRRFMTTPTTDTEEMSISPSQNTKTSDIVK